MSSDGLFLKKGFIYLIGVTLLLNACYSFKGTSISPNVKSFDVRNIRMSAPEAPSNIHLDFMTRLREKIERETRLSYNPDEPDIIFDGVLNGYQLQSEAPTGNRTSAIDRLTIQFEINYNNLKNEKQSWKKNFSHFADMSSSDNFTDRQDELIDIIFDQIAEDIFKAAFSNW